LKKRVLEKAVPVEGERVRHELVHAPRGVHVPVKEQAGKALVFDGPNLIPNMEHICLMKKMTLEWVADGERRHTGRQGVIDSPQPLICCFFCVLLVVICAEYVAR
jgi:hypothetical protein